MSEAFKAIWRNEQLLVVLMISTLAIVALTILASRGLLPASDVKELILIIVALINPSPLNRPQTINVTNDK